MELSLSALKRSRIIYVILMPASATHHRIERENEGIPGKKLQLPKHEKNFKVNDGSYELLSRRPTFIFGISHNYKSLKLSEKLIPYK